MFFKKIERILLKTSDKQQKQELREIKNRMKNYKEIYRERYEIFCEESRRFRNACIHGNQLLLNEFSSRRIVQLKNFLAYHTNYLRNLINIVGSCKC